jgi:citronellol/citronellal dehydrogenase
MTGPDDRRSQLAGGGDPDGSAAGAEGKAPRGIDRPLPFAAELLRDQCVLVTGAAGGIGREIAWLAARLGARVILAGRSLDKLAALEAELGAAGLAATSHPVDVRDRDSVDALYASAGAIDLVIHAAGGQFPQPAIEFSVKGFRAVISTNLEGTFHVMQAAARAWRDAGRGGSIVNIVVSPRGLHHVAHTVAARAGVKAFSEAVAIEWAPLGIRVNCVAPGVIETAGWAAYAPEVAARYPNGNPLRRAGTAWDIATACIFLGGPTAAFVTGETLEVSGGGNLWGETWTTPKPAWFRMASRALDLELDVPPDVPSQPGGNRP